MPKDEVVGWPRSVCLEGTSPSGSEQPLYGFDDTVVITVSDHDVAGHADALAGVAHGNGGAYHPQDVHVVVGVANGDDLPHPDIE